MNRNWLKAERKRAKHSIKTAANRASVDPRTWARYEAGDTTPGDDTWRHIAEMYPACIPFIKSELLGPISGLLEQKVS